MRFIVATRSKDNADEIRWVAKDAPDMEIYVGSFEFVPSFDCVATAGNSFGLMDAGMDLAVLKFFGRELQDTIQKRIIEEFYGEQPGGQLSLWRPVEWIIHMSRTFQQCECQ
jgi:O-acetyl-ADP-ribose deacetylase (regulator of RNase III)